MSYPNPTKKPYRGKLVWSGMIDSSDSISDTFVTKPVITKLEKTEEAIKNGRTRETDNIGDTRHKTKTNKTKNTTQNV